MVVWGGELINVWSGRLIESDGRGGGGKLIDLWRGRLIGSAGGVVRLWIV
jgi:hypothetical protein